MKYIIAPIASALCLLSELGATVPTTPLPIVTAVTPQTDEAYQLVARITPQYAGKVTFRIENNQKSPSIEGKGRYVLITGSHVRECIRAYGYYLRHIAKLHFSWNGDCSAGASFIIPTRKIIVPEARSFNYAFNYCTLSYTTISWDRKRWERELDLLALNGVRYVLVTSGLEKVWQKFLTDLDYPAEKILRFIPNPCYAAWWNMGNLEGEGAPISQSLIDSEAELGRFIVQRLRSLGMEPVLQGYVGLLPHDFPQAGLNGKLLPQGRWCGYKRPTIIQPTAPAFSSLAELWYKHLHSVYGTTAKAYGGDLFHEGGYKGDTALDDAARAIQRSMQKASPGSIWLLQAWGHNPDEQLLVGTEPQHTVILALQKNLAPHARVDFDYGSRPFVWCELSNFGGKHGMFGGMDVVENLTGDSSRAIGIGLISEGLETSPLFYELIWQRMNTLEKINRTTFLQRYALSRYGSRDQRLHAALHLLANEIYTPDKRREGSLENIMCARPDLKARKASTWADPSIYYQPSAIHAAARMYLDAGLAAGSKLTNLPTYRYDLADLCRQVLADRARGQLVKCRECFDRKDATGFRRESEAFLQLIRDCSRVLASSEYFLLGRFIEGARGRGPTSQDKDSMEKSLRQLISTWSSGHGVLNDYSNRQYAEMMQYYYLPRWQAFFSARLQELNGQPIEAEETVRKIVDNNGEEVEYISTRNRNIEAIELAFPEADIHLLTIPVGDIVEIAKSLL